MPVYDAVLFDVDGTLIDSAPGILATMRQTLTEMGVDCEGDDLRRYLGPPLRRTFGEYFSRLEQIEQATAHYRALYREAGAFQCSLYPGVEEMLRALKQGGVRLYTATSKPTVVAQPILERLGIGPLFDEVAGASMDASRDTKTAVIRYVLQKPELAGARALMVGDRRDDLEGAAECGLPAAAVLYGYGSVAEYAGLAPVFMASSCKALTEYILNDKAGRS